jgi:signal transduction histidine kinase
MKEGQEKYRLISIFSLIGFSVLFVFGIDNVFFIKNVNTGLVELFFAFILYVNLTIFQFSKNINIAARVMVITLLLSLLFMYTDGGIGGKTGVYWYFTFPIITFFLLGEKVGFVSSLLLISSTIISYLLNKTPYSLLETRQLIFALITVTLLIRFYWKSNNDIRKMLQVKNEELLKYSERIKQSESLELDKKNEIERTKQAMFNLLEDSRDLEKQLVIEKQNVEEKISLRTKELADEKSKLTASIEALSKAFVMIDTKGEILLVNQNLNKIFSLDNEDWKFEDITKAFGDSFDFKLAYEGVIKTPKIVKYEDIEYGPMVLQVRLSPVYSGEEDKHIIGVLAIIGDVTDEVVHERSKNEFFSIASHELRTPLTAIRGNTSMILDYYKDKIKDPELKSMIKDTHDASIRLIGIVNDFLDLSRLEQNRMEFKFTNFDIQSVIEDVTKQLQSNADEKKIKLDIDVKKGIKVLADIDKVKQVLFNLIGNAIKFTEKGKVSIVVEKGDEFAKIFVKDTGPGIPVSNQSLLFRKFQQAGKSTLTRDGAKGTGLGLFISKLMVEGMKGKISLENSEVGKGSTFTFTLPNAKLN